jgi:restriction endonuclease S subunit
MEKSKAATKSRERINPTGVMKLSIGWPEELDVQNAIADELDQQLLSIEAMRQAAVKQREAFSLLRTALLREKLKSNVNGNRWKLGSVADLADVVMGQSPDGSTYNKVGSGLPLLNGPTEFGIDHPTPVQWTTSPWRTSQPADLLLCVRGNTTGRMNWSDQVYCIGRGVAAVRGKQGLGATKFLRYAIELKLDELLHGSERSTFPNIGKDDIESFKIWYPSEVLMQEEIAQEIERQLESGAAAMRSAETQAEAIKAMPSAILRSIFNFELK